MKLLHITFHKGCELEIEYVFKKLGHDIEVMYFDDGETKGGELYKITHSRAQTCWEKHKDYFNTFDGIITSDTCPTCRPFLQNNWAKLLIVWVCNRFDYEIGSEHGDPEFYQLLRDIPNRKNVFIFGYTMIENVYSTQVKNVNFGDFIIKPCGKNIKSIDTYKTYTQTQLNASGSIETPNKFYVPVYHNETILMNLPEKLKQLDIDTDCKRFSHITDLLEYQGVICIPYAWSTFAFFEMLQLGIVAFVPTIRFLIEIFHTGNYWFQQPFYIQQPEILKLSEWYCAEHKELLVFFDSWEDLQEKVKTIDYETKTQTILDFSKKHHDEMLSRWNTILEKYITSNET
jgi:hypothetical protein